MSNQRPIILLVVLIIVVVLAVGALWWIKSQGENGSVNTNTTPAIDLTSFKAMAQQANCADRRNDLYVIDNQMVFWAKEGACPDASYSYILYGKNPQIVFCSKGDSVFGPMMSCNDTSYQSIFQTIVNNTSKRDLGLGSSHTVKQISLSGNINANANVNTNTSPSDCSLIKTKDECDSRSDCLSVDLCHCTTERYRATKCGYFIENPCVCDTGGFSRCEKLTCPSSTNTNTVTTNTNTIPTDQATCESQGGKWGLVGLNPEPQCNLPTKDGGKECSNADECEAMLCIAELTKEEINSMSGLYTLEKNGKCPEWRFNVGCPWIVNNGKVGRVCID